MDGLLHKTLTFRKIGWIRCRNKQYFMIISFYSIIEIWWRSLSRHTGQNISLQNCVADTRLEDAEMPSETNSDGIWCLKSGNLGLMLVPLTLSDATQTVHCLALPAQEWPNRIGIFGSNDDDHTDAAVKGPVHFLGFHIARLLKPLEELGQFHDSASIWATVF